MKIYFAGAIRGGRQDAPLYHKIIKLLKQHGEVLTEHVGKEDLDQVERGIPDAEIYRRDMSWLEEAEVLIAEVTVASHGVGYEIARAETLGKGILCLYRLEDTQRLSALIAGNPNVEVEQYECFEDLRPILEAFLRDHEPDKQT